MKKICSFCLILALFLSVLSVVPVQAATVVSKGMEVSIANGDVNWQSVKDSGKVDFAMLRVYDGNTKDGAFEANYANATAVGMPLGASMILTATTVNAAKTQANAMLKVLKDRAFPYPICVYVGGNAYTTMNKTLVTNIASAALTTLEAAKYYAVLFMDYSFSNKYIDTATLAASHALCITSANDNDAWAMRCTSKNGKVTGASGTVALFNTYQDFPTIMANAGLNNVTVASGSADWNGIAWDQRNSVWAWNVIGAGTIYDTACGILSTCNAINYLHGSFANTTTANTFILDWANYAHSFGGFNPGQYGADGGYRYRMFGTDISNPPPLQTKYGSTYNFTMPILWTENWNSANYYNGGYYNNIYVNSQTSLKNYLAGDAVAIAHVPGHFICLADYDPATDKFLVLDSYPTWARGTQATAGVEWVSANELSGGRPSLTVGGFCVLKSTKTASTTTTTTQTNKYPYTSGSKYMLYDGETTYEVAGDDASKTKIYLHYEDTQGESSLKMDCTAPTAIGSKGGYASQLLKSTTNLSTYKNFGFDLYLGNDMVGSHSFKVGFWSSGKEVYKATVNLSNLKAGWHEFVMPVSDLVPVSGGKLTQVDALAYTWFNTAKTKNATYICVDNVRMFNGNLSVFEGEKVKEMIGKLPATVTKEDAAAIEEARTAYDTLSQTEKAKVSNLVVLEQAEAQLKALEEEQQPGGEQPDVLYGDLNEDKLVDAKDALIVLRIAVAKQIPTQYQKLVGDVNGDSGIDAKDALEILKKTVGKIDKFPVEQ